MVDYYVYFRNFDEQVSTTDLKSVLNHQLEGQDGMMNLGIFKIDPVYTDFIGKKKYKVLFRARLKNQLRKDYKVYITT